MHSTNNTFKASACSINIFCLCVCVLGSLQVRYHLGGLRAPFAIDVDQRNLANGQPHSFNMSRVDRSITIQVRKRHAPPPPDRSPFISVCVPCVRSPGTNTSPPSPAQSRPRQSLRDLHSCPAVSCSAKLPRRPLPPLIDSQLKARL